MCDDIYENGIVLTGGNALVAAVVDGIRQETGLSARTAERPLDTVALGLTRFLAG